MPSEFQIDYNDFMKWFRLKYPELYAKYGKDIIIQKDATGLKIEIKGGMTQEIHDQLYDIQNEYYSLKK
ncbi:MAG TPA: hypothetical protein VKI61_09725 [Chitinophagaceae bacterium]|nr:hypothetical protein [Chitinophagaceae bacterium]